MDINDKINFLEDWLKKHKRNDSFVSVITRQLAEANMQKSMLDKFPEEKMPDEKQSLEEKFLSNFDLLQPKLDIDTVDVTISPENVAGLTASGSLSGVTYIDTVHVSPVAEEEFLEWKVQSINLISDYQDQFDQEALILEKLEILWPNLVDEFQLATKLRAGVNAGTSTQVELGAALRNVIESANGRIKQGAKQIATNKNERFKDKPKWARIAALVAVNGRDSDHYNELLEIDISRQNMWRKLTNSAKNLEFFNSDQLNALYTEYIEYLFALLLNVDVDKIGGLINQ